MFPSSCVSFSVCVFVFFFKGTDSKGSSNRENRSDHNSQIGLRFERFSIFFSINRFLRLKEPCNERFTINSVGLYGPIRSEFKNYDGEN